MAIIGIFKPLQHAADVQSWIKALINDKNEIFPAASAASKACDFTLDKNRSVETLQKRVHLEPQSQNQDSPAPARSNRQAYHNSSVAIGVVSHALKLAG